MPLTAADRLRAIQAAGFAITKPVYDNWKNVDPADKEKMYQELKQQLRENRESDIADKLEQDKDAVFEVLKAKGNSMRRARTVR